MSEPAEPDAAKGQARERPPGRPVDDVAEPALREGHILRVRLGHGANCSSIGSLVDTLFAMATVGGAVLASVVAAMRIEPVRIAGPSRERRDPGDRGASGDPGDPGDGAENSPCEPPEAQ